MRHLVILNPASCRGDTRASVEGIRSALASRGLDHDLVITERPGHAGEIVEQRGADFEAVIAVGGDGTVHEILQPLDLDRHRLGLIATGSGNDWAWATGWPSDVAACLERIAREEVRHVDVGF